MMKSLLKKRLPGILAAGLVTLAVGAAGVAPATAADAGASALTKAQKKAKTKALKACKKKKNAKQRKACTKKVNKKYNNLAKAPKGKTYQVDVLDPYSYSTSLLNIKVNDSIRWTWKTAGGREPHDVTPVTVPAGVDRNAYKSILTAEPGYKFTRQFKKAGAYSFVCSIHFQMTMDVNVKK